MLHFGWADEHKGDNGLDGNSGDAGMGIQIVGRDRVVWFL